MQAILPLALKLHKVVMLVTLRLVSILVNHMMNVLIVVRVGIGIVLTTPVGTGTVQTVLKLFAQLFLLQVYLQLH
jgi:hypothetical protein